MYSQIERIINLNFILVSFLIIIVGFSITFFLVSRRVDAKYQYISSILTIFLLLIIYWIRLSTLEIKQYAYVIPISHLIIVFLSGFLLFNSIKRYQVSYSRIEFRLIIFYLLNYLVWFILFLQDIFTIGVSDVSQITIMPYLGWFLLVLSLAAALSIYYIGKSIFFMNYRGDRIIESILFVVYGFILGITLGDVNNSLIINSENFHQQTFYFPNLFRIYSIIIIAFLFLPYLIVAFKARSAIKLMNKSNDNGGAIDPVAIPRLKITEISMYVYIIGAGFAIGLTILPAVISELDLPFGLNTILSVPLIAIVNLTLFLAFQTPTRLKNKWRQAAIAA